MARYAQDDEDELEPDELAENRICSGCIGEEFLSAEVEQTGEHQDCAYCGKSGKTISIGELANRVDTAIDEHYYLTPTEPEGIDYLAWKEGRWDRDGEPVVEVIGALSSIDEEPAEHVRRVLEETHFDFHEAAAGEPNKYESEAQYAEDRVKDYELQAGWQHFQQTLQRESRFFNREAEGVLRSIFDELASHVTDDGRPAIIDAGPGQKINALHRARVFQSRAKLEEALKRPDLELGPPPSALASAGRMNARGITVFYGATDLDVALAETRPPVGSKVAVARFEIIRPLRLLDIEALRSVEVNGSMFDRAYLKRLEKAKFLRTLSHRISAAVLPDDEPSEYLVTQAIADYLAALQNPALDGIVYPSVQDGGEQKNVVLFHKSARVEELDIPPDTEISAYLERTDEDGRHPEYRVYEEVPQTETRKPEDDDGFFSVDAFLKPGSPPGEYVDVRSATLRIDAKSVTVHHVGAVNYDKESFEVPRHRSVKREPEFLEMILPDYLARKLEAVFCGTAAGNISAADGHYYAGDNNKFWPILHATGMTAELLSFEDDAQITAHGLGLTDLVKHHSGNDNTLDPEMYDVAGFERKIQANAPRFVAFNGKKPAAVYLGLSDTALVRIGLQDRVIGDTRLFVLPSTSGNAGRFWDEKPWHELVALIWQK